jgi:hypothetical protein
MPGKRISELPALSGAASANDDDIVIFDVSGDTTRRISRSQLAEGMTPDLPLQYYFGLRTEDPTQRLNGDPLEVGDYYLDPVTKFTTVFNGSGWNSYASVIAAQEASEAARDKAQEWSENPEDVEVEPGQFSALHHATKAGADRVQTGLDVVATGADRVQTALNSSAAQADRTGAELARDIAEDFAGLASRATSVAGLVDPTTLVDGDLGIVTGSGDDAVDGVYEVQSGAWVRVADTGLAGKASISLLDGVVGLPYTRGVLSPESGTTTQGSSNSILNSSPVNGDGFITQARVFAQVDGNINVTIYRPPEGVEATTGVTVTRVYNVQYPVVAGVNVIDLDVAVQKGDLVGMAGNGILRFDTGKTGGGQRYYGVSGNSATLGSFAPDVEWQLGFSFVQTNFDDDTAIGAALTSLESSFIDSVGNQAIRGTDEPSIGNATTTGTTVVLDASPVPVNSIVSTVVAQAAADGDMFLHVFRPFGGSVNRVHKITLSLTEGLNSVDVSAQGIDVRKGDLVGMSGAGVMRRTSDTQDFVFYAVADLNSVTLGSTSDSSRFEWRIEIGVDFSKETPIGAEVAALRSDVDQISSGFGSFLPTRGYVLVWGVGQSNLAGRDVNPSQFTIAENRSYKYDHSTTSLVTLADPTGTDSTAQSGSGRSSVGPALAQAVLEATRGRIGVIFVNTAIGGTSIASWQDGQSSWTASLTKWNNTLTDIDAKKLNIVGSCGVMMQGENDAANETDPATYKAGVLGLLSQMQAETGMDDFKLILAQTGINTTGSTSASYAAIRNAQAELARENPDILMAHSRAKHFVDDGFYIDTLHYSIEGLDEIGGAFGAAIVSNAIGSRPTGIAE